LQAAIVARADAENLETFDALGSTWTPRGLLACSAAYGGRYMADEQLTVNSATKALSGR
jgi:hypothetical protein